MHTISSAEFTKWIAYSRVEHFGTGMDDLRMGTLCATIANVSRDPKKKPKPYQPIDFITWMDRPEVKKPRPSGSSRERAKFTALTVFGIDLDDPAKGSKSGRKIIVKRRSQKS